MKFVSRLCFFRVDFMICIAALFESAASEPPFKTEALPDLKQSEKTSKVTFGRAS